MNDLKREDFQRVRVRATGQEIKWILAIPVYHTGYGLYLCHRRSETCRLSHCLPSFHLCQSCSWSLSEVQLILATCWSRKLNKLFFKFEKGLRIERSKSKGQNLDLAYRAFFLLCVRETSDSDLRRFSVRDFSR